MPALWACVPRRRTCRISGRSPRPAEAGCPRRSQRCALRVRRRLLPPRTTSRSWAARWCRLRASVPAAVASFAATYASAPASPSSRTRRTGSRRRRRASAMPRRGWTSPWASSHLASATRCSARPCRARCACRWHSSTSRRALHSTRRVRSCALRSTPSLPQRARHLGSTCRLSCSSARRRTRSQHKWTPCVVRTTRSPTRRRPTTRPRASA
mmetsp:Transcript_3906/g.14504  ORF Transcript_3906/g.14504 Transcript_3906/m.14504 type:complete len:212 (-) Transcript_3906:780-1415(-)